ncbi:hypothetical protein SY89_02052 [Halolamina pelagica]|uniref:Polyketide cyclase / dehydrase and lipid transport n=1 Tax=Halolamina pelagica TaxID=699431 RepID=A0A0P7HW82_9EURY|nr:hypothetical protein SY89_02052 [Halolamina pelagica]
MTVRVERTFTFDAPAEQVWEFIADPAKRAEAISVVESYEVTDEDGREAVWQVSLPIPGIGATVAVETEDVERDPRSTSSSSADRRRFALPADTPSSPRARRRRCATSSSSTADSPAWSGSSRRTSRRNSTTSKPRSGRIWD